MGIRTGDATTGPVDAEVEAAALAAAFDPTHWRDPYPTYDHLRAVAPIARRDGDHDWVLTRWADCEAVLRDTRWSSSPNHRRPEDLEGDIRAVAGDSGVRTLLFLDPPDHTRLRRLVSKAFTPRAIERIRGHVRELADELLGGIAPGQPFDLIEVLAYPLPVIVICELLGVPVADRDRFAGWSSAASRLLDRNLSEAELTEGFTAMMSFVNYFNALIVDRRANPKDDLLTGLVQAEEEGDRLTEEELRSIIVLLFVAGHETTMNLIGNGTFALLRQRDQWDRLVADPGLAPAAVEELLRFDGPVHVTGRVATVDGLEVGGRTFNRGDAVVALLAAANRDPERFEAPDTVDITRADNQHLTFSHGIHYCLGAALARLEGQVVFEELATRFPDLALAVPEAEVVHRNHYVLRGLKALPVVNPA